MVDHPLPRDLVAHIRNTGLPLRGGGSITIPQYLCANPANGGNENAEMLQVALNGLIAGGAGAHAAATGDPDHGRVFMGQGKLSSVAYYLNFIHDNIDRLARQRLNPTSGPYQRARTAGVDRPTFQLYVDRNPQQPLIPMIEDKMFGWDCIGFVWQYMVGIGLVTGYRRYSPFQFFNVFEPVHDADEAGPLGVVVWAENQHIGLIDAVVNRRTMPSGQKRLTIDLAQCTTNRRTGMFGPQLNAEVELIQTGEEASVGTWNRGRVTARVFTMRPNGRPAAPFGGRVLLGRLNDAAFLQTLGCQLTDV